MGMFSTCLRRYPRHLLLDSQKVSFCLSELLLPPLLAPRKHASGRESRRANNSWKGICSSSSGIDARVCAVVVARAGYHPRWKSTHTSANTRDGEGVLGEGTQKRRGKQRQDSPLHQPRAHGQTQHHWLPEKYRAWLDAMAHSWWRRGLLARLRKDHRLSGRATR
jgi:hypothetical protein